MDDALIHDVDAGRARRCIASAIAGGLVEIPRALGGVELRDRQRALAARVARLLDQHRGALLADPVGLGKTYAALAVGRRFDEVVIIAPASLREMWKSACALAGTQACIVSHEALSGGTPHVPAAPAGTLLIVDEAHRFRNPATRRYARLTELARDASVLLVSATPIQNRLQDLAAPLALFLGSEALTLTAADLARYVVRESAESLAERLPVIVGPERVPVAVEPSIVGAILGLPSPLAASDEGLAAVLVAQLLVRRWMSSQASLTESLRRLLTKTIALHDAALAGRRITRSDLGLWSLAEDSVQLAFPSLTGEADAGGDGPATLHALEAHAKALRVLLRCLARAPAADAARARALLELRQRHRGERIVVFSQYARTVEALFARCAPAGGIAALTARGARIATGRITRAECLGQFTPEGDRSRSSAAQIDLLLATDLLSEGLNLQRASVVVHLDLPWNPARLDQRVGRVRRVGSLHEHVSVYQMDPVGVGGVVEALEARLRAKLRIAGETVGVTPGVLPAHENTSVSTASCATAEALGETQHVVESWLRAGPAERFAAATRDDVVIATVHASRGGWLCAYSDGGGDAMLVADISGRVGDDASHLRAAIAFAGGAQAEADRGCALASVEAARNWIDSRRAARAVDFRVALTGMARRGLLAGVAYAVSRSPHHRRAAVARTAERARAAAVLPLSLAAEQELMRLVHLRSPDEEWLEAIARFAARHARGGRTPSSHPAAHIVAMIVFDARMGSGSDELMGSGSDSCIVGA